MNTIPDLILALDLMSPNQAMYLIHLNAKGLYKYQISFSEVEDLLAKKLIFLQKGKYKLSILALKSVVVATKMLAENTKDAKSEELDNWFTDIFNLFPYKTPSGRLLKPKAQNTILGVRLKAKLKKALLHSKAIDITNGLRLEIDYRNRKNSLEYMRNMETWFNRAEWENYDDTEGEISDELDDFIDYG